MSNMLTCSMACFPYVMMGLGQVIIVGINQTERKADNTDTIRGWKVTHRIFEKISVSAGDERMPDHLVLLPS